MQVDRICSAEAAIKINQNKQKKRRGHLFNERVIVHCLIMAQRHRHKWTGKWKQDKENLQTWRRRKEKKDEHLILSTLSRTILFYANYKNNKI